MRACTVGDVDTTPDRGRRIGSISFDFRSEACSDRVDVVTRRRRVCELDPGDRDRVLAADDDVDGAEIDPAIGGRIARRIVDGDVRRSWNRLQRRARKANVHGRPHAGQAQVLVVTDARLVEVAVDDDRVAAAALDVPEEHIGDLRAGDAHVTNRRFVVAADRRPRIVGRIGDDDVVLLLDLGVHGERRVRSRRDQRDRTAHFVRGGGNRRLTRIDEARERTEDRAERVRDRAGRDRVADLNGVRDRVDGDRVDQILGGTGGEADLALLIDALAGGLHEGRRGRGGRTAFAPDLVVRDPRREAGDQARGRRAVVRQGRPHLEATVDADVGRGVHERGRGRQRVVVDRDRASEDVDVQVVEAAVGFRGLDHVGARVERDEAIHLLGTGVHRGLDVADREIARGTEIDVVACAIDDGACVDDRECFTGGNRQRTVVHRSRLDRDGRGLVDPDVALQRRLDVQGVSERVGVDAARGRQHEIVGNEHRCAIERDRRCRDREVFGGRDDAAEQRERALRHRDRDVLGGIEALESSDEAGEGEVRRNRTRGRRVERSDTDIDVAQRAELELRRRQGQHVDADETGGAQRRHEVGARVVDPDLVGVDAGDDRLFAARLDDHVADRGAVLGHDVSAHEHVAGRSQFDEVLCRDRAVDREQRPGVENDGVGRDVARHAARAVVDRRVEEHEVLACAVLGELRALQELVDVDHARRVERDAAIEIDRSDTGTGVRRGLDVARRRHEANRVAAHDPVDEMRRTRDAVTHEEIVLRRDDHGRAAASGLAGDHVLDQQTERALVGAVHVADGDVAAGADGVDHVRRDDERIESLVSVQFETVGDEIDVAATDGATDFARAGGQRDPTCRAHIVELGDGPVACAGTDRDDILTDLAGESGDGGRRDGDDPARRARAEGDITVEGRREGSRHGRGRIKGSGHDGRGPLDGLTVGDTRDGQAVGAASDDARGSHVDGAGVAIEGGDDVRRAEVVVAVEFRRKCGCDVDERLARPCLVTDHPRGRTVDEREAVLAARDELRAGEIDGPCGRLEGLHTVDAEALGIDLDELVARTRGDDHGRARDGGRERRIRVHQRGQRARDARGRVNAGRRVRERDRIVTVGIADGDRVRRVRDDLRAAQLDRARIHGHGRRFRTRRDGDDAAGRTRRVAGVRVDHGCECRGELRRGLTGSRRRGEGRRRGAVRRRDRHLVGAIRDHGRIGQIDRVNTGVLHRCRTDGKGAGARDLREVNTRRHVTDGDVAGRRDRHDGGRAVRLQFELVEGHVARGSQRERAARDHAVLDGEVAIALGDGDVTITLDVHGEAVDLREQRHVARRRDRQDVCRDQRLLRGHRDVPRTRTGRDRDRGA